MLRIALGVLWRLLLLLVLLFVGALIFIGGSETGLRGTLNLVDRILPGAIRYQSLQGALVDQLAIDGLQIRFGDFELDVEQFRFVWQASELLSGHLQIEQLHAERIRMVLPPSEEAPPSTEPLQLPSIELPLRVTLQELRIRDLALATPEADAPFLLTRLEVALHSEQNTLILDRLEIDIPQLHAQASGQLTPADDYPLNLDVNWRFEHSQWGELRGQGQVNGILASKITLSHAVDGIASVTLEAQLDHVLREPAWNIALQVASADLGMFVPELAQSPAHLELLSEGTRHGFNIRGSANSTVPEAGPISAQFDVDGTTQALHIKTLKLLAENHPLSVNLNADIDLITQALSARGDWRSLAWPLSGPPQIASSQGFLQVSGTLEDFQAELQADLQGEQLGELQTRLSASGSTQELRSLQLKVTEPQGDLRLDLNGSARLDDLNFAAKANWQQLRWPLTAAAQIVSPDGELSAQGNPDDYSASLNASLNGPQLILLDATAQVSGGRQQLRLSQLQVQARDGDVSLRARAELALDTLDFSASGTWQNLSWPLNPYEGSPDYQSENGEFQADGNLQDYAFTLDSKVGGKALPSGTWQMQGNGTASELKNLRIGGETLEGQLHGTIQARWQPSIDWQIKMTGQNLNPGAKWPDVPGRLDFELLSDGRLKEGQIEAKLQLAQLQGQLSGQDVRGEADIEILGQALNIRKLDLQAGQANLSANGALAEQWNMDWRLNVPELGGLLPKASGNLSGRGQLRGNLQNPQAQAELNGRQLRFGDIQLTRLRSQANLDLNGQSDIELNAQELSMAGQNWKTISVSGSGSLQQHSVNLKAQGDLGNYGVILKGGWDGSDWQGQLSQIALQETPGGTWRLAKSAGLAAGPQQATLSRLCLSSPPSELCMQGEWSAASGGRADVELKQLDLSRFAEFLPETIRISNTLQGKLKGQLSPAGAINGDVNIQLSAGDMTVLVNGQPVKIAIQGGSIAAQSDGASAQSKIMLDLGTIGQLQSAINARNLPDTPTLQADLQAAINDFSIVSKLVPDVQDIEGALKADIQVSGALPTPNIQGEVILRDGAVSVPQTGTRIEAIQLQTTTSSAGRLRFNGSARSGEGELNLEGSLAPFEQQAEVIIKGDKFEALDSFSQMLISPDMQIVVESGQIRVNGTVEVPSAQLSPPATGRSRISPSEDVIIAANESDPASAQKTEIYAKLRVILGEDVWVNTDVFTAQLKGDIQVEQTPQLSPRGSGTVEVIAGSYKIYGQELNIERGRLLFSGGPINNPGLDLRISRVFGEDNDTDQVTVGAQVVGPVSQPELELFSMPPMLESDIVAYLVFGRPPSGSGGENQLLYQAAAALGASQGNKLTQGLSEGLGVDLSLDTGSSLEETGLVIGKYLSPELYVSYGVGLFDEAVNTFNLRYQLTRWLSLHIDSSSAGDSGADLLYTIER